MGNGLRDWALIWLLYGFSTVLPAAAAPWTCRASFLHLAGTAYQLDFMREPEEKRFYQLYKNDSHFLPWLTERAQAEQSLTEILKLYDKEKSLFRPKAMVVSKTFDLTSPESLTESTELCAACRGATGLKHYDEWVIGLRQGDTVLFNGKKFTLGKFLGAGGAAQIFALEGRPDEAIKIPLVWGGRGVAHARKVMREFIALESKIPADVPRVTILEKGTDGEFVVVTKVDVTEDGKEFLERYKPGTGAQQLQERELGRLVRLAAGLDEKAPLSEDRYQHLARQFGWNGSRWTLLDWE